MDKTTKVLGIGMRFELSANAYESLSEHHWEWKIDDGAWSGEYSTERGNGTQLEDIIVKGAAESVNTTWFDYFSPSSGVAEEEVDSSYILIFE